MSCRGRRNGPVSTGPIRVPVWRPRASRYAATSQRYDRAMARLSKEEFDELRFVVSDLRSRESNGWLSESDRQLLIKSEKRLKANGRGLDVSLLGCGCALVVASVIAMVLFIRWIWPSADPVSETQPPAPAVDVETPTREDLPTSPDAVTVRCAEIAAYLYEYRENDPEMFWNDLNVPDLINEFAALNCSRVLDQHSP